jgi:hypothetical protein
MKTQQQGRSPDEPQVQTKKRKSLQGKRLVLIIIMLLFFTSGAVLGTLSVLGIIQPTWATILSTIILPMLAITLPFDTKQLPVRLSMLTILDLTHSYRAEHELGRLVQALQGPLPLQ